jgi:hypothetical protein
MHGQVLFTEQLVEPRLKYVHPAPDAPPSETLQHPAE